MGPISPLEYTAHNITKNKNKKETNTTIQKSLNNYEKKRKLTTIQKSLNNYALIVCLKCLYLTSSYAPNVHFK